jgi:serine/threonine protein kinase
MITKEEEQYDIRNDPLLIMENGGDNLEQFSKKLLQGSNSQERVVQIERFWLEAHRVLMGVKVFLDHGVIHHDLKPQNIVYNETTDRINFIDFGLIQDKKTVIKDAAKSKYGFGKYHWSFPLECKFLNKKAYDKFAAFSDKYKMDHIKNIASTLKEGGGTEASDAIRFYLHYAANETGSFLNLEKATANLLKHFGETLLHVITPGQVPYETMVNKCVDTFDSYGVGFGLLNVLKNAHTKMDIHLSDDLAKLFQDMTNANVMKRISIETAIHRYEEILEKNKVLKRFNKHFKNHLLTDGPLIPVVLEKTIADSSEKTKSISPKEMKEIIAENPEIMEPKPLSELPKEKSSQRPLIEPVKLVPKKKGLIIKGVRELSSRNGARQSGVSGTYGEKPYKEKMADVCPEGKETNPKTRRCVKKCKEGETRNDKFECRKTQRKWRRRKSEKNMIE